MTRKFGHVRFSPKLVQHISEQNLLPTTISVLHGGDQQAFEQFTQEKLQRVYDFVVRELEYHDALNTLSANEVSPYEIVDEAYARAIEKKQSKGSGQSLPTLQQLQHQALEVVHGIVATQEERERRETSLEGEYADPAEEDGFRTLGEYVLDFWQPDQDLTQQDLIPDLEMPTPVEIEDMKARERELYSALNALPRRWREDFVLFAIEKWSPSQIAERHAISPEVLLGQIRATQSFLLERLRERALLESRAARQLPHQHPH